MKNLLYDEYFSQHSQGKDLARIMWASLNESPAREKTLFVLDGLDEVSQEWLSGTPMDEFLSHLLRQPQVIITSRPQTLNRSNLEPLDLELETIGFFPEQVTAYIEKLHNKPISEQIQKFINSRWLIRGLVRIPIQLDALCYSWNHDFHSDGGPKNMTALYETIKLKLWKKDICQLEKSYAGKRLTEAEISNLRTAKQIEPLVEDEAKLLEYFAFSGLYNNVVDFNVDYRDKIIEQLPSKGIVFSDNVLARLSFLRTSDSGLREEEKSYHFLHLTFQEFFAASHFARQWIVQKPLFCFTTSGNRGDIDSDIKPHNFLQKEKYNARYNIFWRFVTGLLQSCRDKGHLLRFLQILDGEPRDLLGPSYERLLMHCFSEVPTESHLEHLRKDMNARLKQWAFFEYKLMGMMTLCFEMEFPDDVLITMMNEEKSEDVKYAILQALQRRSNLSSCLLNQTALFLGQNVSTDLKIKALEVLGERTPMPEAVLQAIMLLLQQSNEVLKNAAILALSKQMHQSEYILQAIIYQLENSSLIIKETIFNVLNRQISLSKDMLQPRIHQLEDPHEMIREYAMGFLSKQIPWSDDILQAIVRRLEDSHETETVRYSAIDVLSKQTPWSEDILQAIVRRLEDSNKRVREFAIYALCEQTPWSEDSPQAKAIVRQLRDTNEGVRFSAIAAQDTQTPWSEGTVKTVVLALSKISRSLPRYARLLLNQDNLYDNLLNFDVETLRSVYKILIWESFSEQIYCYWQDEILYIDLPNRRRMISLAHKDLFLKAFRDEALALGSPSPTYLGR